MVQNSNWFWKLELGIFVITSGAIINSCGCNTAVAQDNIATDIVSDNTLGGESSIVLPLAPGSSVDEIRGGAIRGANLFHSFLEFNVGEGQGAYFYNPNSSIQNILARVTGSNISEILGTIGTSGNSNPNLFLINPNGIIFGQNASLDVQGSFVATTASAIEFGNQGYFNAENPNIPSLLTVNPSAFLFHQIEKATIQNNSTAPAGLDPSGLDSFGLRVPNTQSLLLIGSNINIDGGGLNAYDGRVELAALAGIGEVGLMDDMSLTFPDTVARASVSLNNNSRIDVSGSGRGSIVINAQNLDISESYIFAGILPNLETNASQAGDITLNATEAISVRQSSSIANIVDSNASSSSGNLIITTGSLVVDESQLIASTFGQGNAGNIQINAREQVSFDQSNIYSTVESGAVGNSGDIYIKASSLTFNNGAALITSTSGKGNAGNINIAVREGVVLDGADNNGLSSSAYSTVESGAIGNGGNIDIKARSLALNNGAQLQTIVRETSGTLAGGQGNAGNINIDVRDTVLLDGFGSNGNPSAAFSSVETGGVGNSGDIDIVTGFLSLSNRAGIIARMLGQGTGGSINIKASELSLSSNALLEGDLDQTGQGRGANINLDVMGTILLTGGETAPTGESTRITLGVLPGGIGEGGDLRINAGSLILKDGAIIKASTQGQGNAGNIQVNTDVIDISGAVESSGLPSGLFTSTDTNFRAGDIIIDTRAFQVTNGAALSARSRGNGQGGNITVNASNSFALVNGGQLVTTTFGKGQAGNIFVNTKDQVSISGRDPNYANRIAKFPNPIDPLVANAITETGATSGLLASTETNSTGQGGNISITTAQLLVEDGAVRVNSQGLGNAGSIEAQANFMRLSNGSSFNADTTAGEGNINLRSGNLILRRGSSITTRATGNNITGGNIYIDTNNLVAVPKENSDISADSENFRGGNVRIEAQGLFGTQFRSTPTIFSDITATGANSELSGIVEIITPDIDPSRGLINLPDVPVDTQVAQGCAADGSLARNEFIITGRGGLPPNPDEALSTDAVQVDLITLDPKVNTSTNTVPTSTNPTPARIVEATNWVIDKNGNVLLTVDVHAVRTHSSWHPTKCSS